MKVKFLTVFTALALSSVMLASCGEGGGGEGGEGGEGGTITTTQSSAKQGFHMPGRDCLACHNYDLQTVRHLTVGGTVFKRQNVNNVNDVNNLCGGNLVIKFCSDTNCNNVVYNSANYKDPNSKGYKGKGNVFILSRKLLNLQGNYYVQITDETGSIIAQSNGLHSFNSGYDIKNPKDFNNRYSCNTCHSKGSNPGVIFQNKNKNANLCK